MGYLYRSLLPRLIFLTTCGLLIAFIYHIILGNVSLYTKRNSRWHNPAMIIDIPKSYFDSSQSFPLLSVFRDSPNDVIIRSVYFDDRPRDGHSNMTVFLLEVRAKIIDYNLLSGCQVGVIESSDFQVRDCFLNSWLQTSGTFESEHHTHWCIMLDCFDLPAKNGSGAFIKYKYITPKHIKRGEWESLTHQVHRTVTVESPTALFFPPVYKPLPINKDHMFTIAVCRGPVFGTPPLLYEWIQYQKTIGVDHVYLIVEKSFLYETGFERTNISQAIKEGFVSYRVWDTAREDVHSYYRSQMIATEDCLYRLRGVYDYVVIMDTDDFFTPLTQHKSLHYYVNNWCHRNKTCGALNMRWIQFHTECGMKGKVPADGNVTSVLASDVKHMFDIHNNVNYKTVHRLEAAVDIRIHKHGVFMSGYSHVLLPVTKAIVAHVREHKVHEGTRCAKSLSGLNDSIKCVC